MGRLSARISQQIHILGRSHQFVPEPRIGQGDYRLGPLPGVPALEFGLAVLGDQPVDVLAGSGHGRPLFQLGDNPGDGPLFGRGVKSQDRLASLGIVGPPDVIKLPAGPAELMAGQVFGVALPGQVDLDNGVIEIMLSLLAITSGRLQ